MAWIKLSLVHSDEQWDCSSNWILKFADHHTLSFRNQWPDEMSEMYPPRGYCTYGGCFCLDSLRKARSNPLVPISTWAITIYRRVHRFITHLHSAPLLRYYFDKLVVIVEEGRWWLSWVIIMHEGRHSIHHQTTIENPRGDTLSTAVDGCIYIHEYIVTVHCRQMHRQPAANNDFFYRIIFTYTSRVHESRVE